MTNVIELTNIVKSYQRGEIEVRGAALVFRWPSKRVR